MTSTYLLYLDILGFKKMVAQNDPRIDDLFERVDTLLVFKDEAFKTLIFSDTIICFLKHNPRSKEARETMLMYACEASQSLFYHCVQLGIVFRGILTFGEFKYTKHKHFDSYYGKALIDAYQKDNGHEITGTGLFVDKSISNNLNIFRTIEYNDKFDFVYPNQSIRDFENWPKAAFPIDWTLLEGQSLLDLDAKYFKFLKNQIDTHHDEYIRSKYLTTYGLYKKRFSGLIEFLELNDFDHRKISPEVDWEEKLDEFPRNLY